MRELCAWDGRICNAGGSQGRDRAQRHRRGAGDFCKATGFEVTLLPALICLAYLFGGGGRYSLDRRIGRQF